MKTITYNCKFCQKPGSVDCDEQAVSDFFVLDKWLPLLACNRCADFERARRDMERLIMRECGRVVDARKDWIEMKVRSRIEDASRSALSVLTERFARIVANHYHQPVVWDDEFTNTLMDSPEKGWSLLSFYRARMVKAAAETP